MSGLAVLAKAFGPDPAPNGPLIVSFCLGSPPIWCLAATTPPRTTAAGNRQHAVGESRLRHGRRPGAPALCPQYQLPQRRAGRHHLRGHPQPASREQQGQALQSGDHQGGERLPEAPSDAGAPGRHGMAARGGRVHAPAAAAGGAAASLPSPLLRSPP